MFFTNLFYLLNQRIQYRKAKSDFERKIIEINMHRSRVIDRGDFYEIPEVNVNLPKSGFEEVFFWFSLFLQLPQRLKGKYINEGSAVHFLFDELKIKINSLSEIFILNEIFYKKCYNFKFAENNDLIVVDMGMNVGLASLFFAQHEHVKAVYAYEPFKPTYLQALENFNNTPEYANKITAWSFGLGNLERKIKMPYNASNSGNNSSISNSSDTNSNGIQEELTIKNAALEINSIIAKHPKAKLILKIDTEGAEYEIFEALFSNQLHENIIGFMIEWHKKGPEFLEEHLMRENFKIVSTLIEPNSGLIYAFR